MDLETRKKISNSLKGRKKTLKTKQKMCLAQKGRFVSEETKKKISESLKGRKLSLETRKKLSKIHTERKHSKLSLEAKVKLSLSRKGKKHSENWKISDEGKKRISEAQKTRNRIVSLETRQKLSEIGKGKIISEQCKQKLSRATTEAHKMGKFKNVNSSKKFKQGLFFSKKNNKQIHYRSSWELQVYKILEQISKVKFYEPEPLWLEYIDEDKKKKGYKPDILVTYTDNSRDLLEIKPKCFMMLPSNVLKFKVGTEYAQKNDMNFLVITEDEIKTKQVLS